MYLDNAGNVQPLSLRYESMNASYVVVDCEDSARGHWRSLNIPLGNIESITYSGKRLIIIDNSIKLGPLDAWCIEMLSSAGAEVLLQELSGRTSAKIMPVDMYAPCLSGPNHVICFRNSDSR